ncbi:MAG: MFS transporter [Cuniculiplasma sp.]
MIGSNSETVSLMKRNGITVVASNQFIRVLARSQMWIFLPLYLLVIRHVPYLIIGFVIFLMAISSLPLTLVAGGFIDKHGPRTVIIISNTLLAVLLILLTVFIFGNSNLYLIYLVLILSEPLMNIIGAADNVIISDNSTASERNSAFSIVRILQNLGFSLGPAIGGFIAGIGYGYIFLLTSVFSVTELFVYMKFLKKTAPVKGEEKDEQLNMKPDILKAFKDRPFFIVAILISLFFLIMGQWGTTLTFFWKGFDHMTDLDIGILYSVNGVVVTLGQLPVNRLLRKMGDIGRINLGYIVYLLSFSILPFFQGFTFLVLDTILITMGENIISPSINTIISRIAPVNKRGQYFTSFQVLTGMVTPLAPVLGTLLLTVFAADLGLIWYPIMILGTILFISAIPLWKKVHMSEHNN